MPERALTRSRSVHTRWRMARRSHTSGIVASGASLILLLTACPGSHASEVIPWIAAAAAPTSSVAPPPPVGTTRCSTHDLRIGRFYSGGAAAGTFYERAEIVNMSSSACYLATSPVVRLSDARGRSVQGPDPLDTDVMDFPMIVPTALALAMKKPHAYRVWILFGTSDNCTEPQVASLQMSLPNKGGTVRIEIPPSGSGFPGEMQCPAGETSHDVRLVSDAPPPPEPPPSPLTATILISGPAHAGMRYRYVVRITNPTQALVSLDPCPSYDEAIKGLQGAVESHLLNCATVHSINPGRSVQYEMFLSVPRDVPRGPLNSGFLLTWGFTTTAGPYANARLQVLG